MNIKHTFFSNTMFSNNIMFNESGWCTQTFIINYQDGTPSTSYEEMRQRLSEMHKKAARTKSRIETLNIALAQTQFAENLDDSTPDDTKLSSDLAEQIARLQKQVDRNAEFAPLERLYVAMEGDCVEPENVKKLAEHLCNVQAELHSKVHHFSKFALDSKRGLKPTDLTILVGELKQQLTQLLTEVKTTTQPINNILKDVNQLFQLLLEDGSAPSSSKGSAPSKHTSKRVLEEGSGDGNENKKHKEDVILAQDFQIFFTGTVEAPGLDQKLAEYIEIDESGATKMYVVKKNYIEQLNVQFKKEKDNKFWADKMGKSFERSIDHGGWFTPGARFQVRKKPTQTEASAGGVDSTPPDSDD